MIEGEEGATPADENVQRSIKRQTFLKGGAVAGATLMVGGVLAACGASDSGSGGGGDAAASTGGGGSTADYVIGGLYPLTGPNASDGEQMNNGAQLAIDEINAAGGVGGRMLKLVALDTDLVSPEKIQQNYQKLADQKVDAVINGYLLAWDAAMDAAASYGAPFLNASTSQAQCDKISSDPKYSCIFQVDPPETWYGRGFPSFLNNLIAEGSYKPRNKKIFIVEGNVPYSQVISKVTQEQAPKDGWEIAGVEPMGAGAMTDWGPILAKVKAADAAVVMNTHYLPSELATFTKGFAADPTDSLLYVQYGASVPEYLELAGDSANGAVWAITSMIQRFVASSAFSARTSSPTQRFEPVFAIRSFSLSRKVMCWLSWHGFASWQASPTPAPKTLTPSSGDNKNAACPPNHFSPRSDSFSSLACSRFRCGRNGAPTPG